MLRYAMERSHYNDTPVFKYSDEVCKRWKSAEPMPGLLDLLQRCKEAGIQLAVVTSDSTSAAETHLDWMGIRSFSIRL